MRCDVKQSKYLRRLKIVLILYNIKCYKSFLLSENFGRYRNIKYSNYTVFWFGIGTLLPIYNLWNLCRTLNANINNILTKLSNNDVVYSLETLLWYVLNQHSTVKYYKFLNDVYNSILLGTAMYIMYLWGEEGGYYLLCCCNTRK